MTSHTTNRTIIYNGKTKIIVWVYKSGHTFIEIQRDDITATQIEIPYNLNKPIEVKEIK